MKSRTPWTIATAFLATILVAGTAAQEPKPAAPTAPAAGAMTYTVRMVDVEQGVKLEVLDWGGTGRPVVLLAGLGGTAHGFNSLAAKLAADYHVYGITRRGFGASSVPASGYDADRLGDDVLAVIDALALKRPVLAGHSLAGEELSSIGSRHPEKVAGLVYLDAAYPYAFYDSANGDLHLDAIDLRAKLEQLFPGKGPSDPRPLIAELLAALPRLEKNLLQLEKSLPPAGAPLGGPPNPPAVPAPIQAIFAGERKYTEIHAPALAIFALPHEAPPPLKKNPEALAKFEADDLVRTEAAAKAFEAGVPGARVVRLPHANHFVFRSNEADVVREVKAFIATLPSGS